MPITVLDKKNKLKMKEIYKIKTFRIVVIKATCK